MTSRQKTLGLIAGQGRFPFLVAEGARRAGLKVVTLALRDSASPELADCSDVFRWVPVARPGRWIRLFHRHGVARAIMAGRVAKVKIFQRFRILRNLPDLRALRIWYRKLARKDRRNRALLTAVADELASEGIQLENSMKYCPEHLAVEGVMGQRPPTEKQSKDIEFGWPLARRLAEMDIGQSLAVNELEVIAVEAIEGTDAMIARAGRLCPRGGWTLIKLAQSDQDMRFDVPTVGPETIEHLAAAGAKCLVLEAGKVLTIDRPGLTRLTDRHGITIIGR